MCTVLFTVAFAENFGRDTGIPGQISLTYDMTFVVLLLSALYEPPTKKGTSRCVVHPLKPQPVRKNYSN